MQNTFKVKHLYMLLLLITLIVTSIRIGILSAHVWPLNGDETQYWSWAKHLAWGYYSKPPMIAWLIALTTKLFGNGIVAMRLASPILHSVTTLLIFSIARRIFSDETGFWAGLIYLSMPGVTFSATIISTDPALLMFWALGLYCFIRALEKNQYVWWIGLGVALGLAMLSKYAALFFPLSVLCYLLIDQNNRCYLFKPGFYLAIAIASLIFLPNILWNLDHAFVSVMAVKDNASLQSEWFHPNNLLNFIGSQFIIFSPIMFMVLLLSLFNKATWQLSHYRLLLAFIIPVLVIMSVEALLVHAHGNWAAPIYIAASILVAALLIRYNKRYFLILTLLLNSLIILGFINVESIVRNLAIRVHQPTTLTNLKEMGNEIQSLRAQYPDAKVLVNRRMLLTEIMYFGNVPLKETFKWNPMQVVKDQYDLVTHLSGESHHNFLLFSYDYMPSAIFNHFTSVKVLPTITLFSLDGRSLLLYVYYLKDFKGYGQ